MNKSSDRITDEKESFNEILEKLEESDYKIDHLPSESQYISDTD